MPRHALSPTSTVVGVLAGPGAWGYPAEDQRFLLGESGLVVATVATVGSFALDLYGLNASLQAKLLICALTLSSLAAWLALGTGRVAALFPAPVPLAICRTLALVVVVATWTATNRDLETLQLWPLGAVGGFESFLTMRSLGLTDSTEEIVRRMILSPVSVGSLAGCLLVGALDIGGLGWPGAAKVYAGMVLAFLAGTGSFFAADRAERRASSEAERHRNEGRLAELSARADWIHNEVIGTINPIRQRNLGSNNPELVKTGELLDEIIQEWRTTQLDLAIASRPVRLAEIISHVTRSYRRLGIDVVAPGAETGQLVLNGDAADHTCQALSITMSNAAIAGAQRIDVGVEATEDELVVTVADDGSGFESNHLPQGRGLDRLSRVLAGPVEFFSDDSGTLVTLRVARFANDG